MATTVLFPGSDAQVVDGRDADGRLWLSADDLHRVTGWTLKPEGLCREDACVPLPADGSWQDQDGRIDLTAFAARAGRPAVRDGERDIWGFGEPAEARSGRGSALAPDFTLPDVDGNPRSLSDFRGRKVFLLAWGSY